MALAYSSTYQDQIALRVFGRVYSSLDTEDKKLIDSAASPPTLTAGYAFDALTEVQEWSQAFSHAGATAAPDVWAPWFVSLACAKVAASARPELRGSLWEAQDRARESAFSSYTRTTSNSATLSGQSLHVQGIRFYVLNEWWQRRRSPPQVEQIDSTIQEVINELWNGYEWPFRKRRVTMRIIRVAAAGATWTESSLSLGETGAFAGYTAQAGDVFILTGGTSVVKATYRVDSDTGNDDDTLPLLETCSTTGGNLSGADITGVVVQIKFVGMGGESFDSVASRMFQFTDTTNREGQLVWSEPDEFTSTAAHWGTNATGRPRIFRVEPSGSTFVWHLFPIPDQSYTTEGTVFISGPGTPANATATAVFDKFPSEFGSVIRRAVLARLLTTSGAEDAALTRSVENDIERMLPAFADTGRPDDEQSVRDVYGDYGMTNRSVYSGGYAFGGS